MGSCSFLFSFIPKFLNLPTLSNRRTKYPLATIKRLITVGGKKIGGAYDIGCALDITLQGTSLIDFVRENDFSLMVGAFHGHAHNRLCQLQWHPTYIKGTGHSEGEGCEQVFSASNDLTRASRHASTFHRHQMIKQHFQFWDEDKYANLSKSFDISDFNASLIPGLAP